MTRESRGTDGEGRKMTCLLQAGAHRIRGTILYFTLLNPMYVACLESKEGGIDMTVPHQEPTKISRVAECC